MLLTKSLQLLFDRLKQFSDWNNRREEQSPSGPNQVRLRAVPLVSHPLRVVQECHEGNH